MFQPAQKTSYCNKHRNEKKPDIGVLGFSLRKLFSYQSCADAVNEVHSLSMNNGRRILFSCLYEEVLR
jgi:hypothetical protein